MKTESFAAMLILTKVEKVASAITPVPGGVGPMTIAMLMRNTPERPQSVHTKTKRNKEQSMTNCEECINYYYDEEYECNSCMIKVWTRMKCIDL